MIEFTLNMPMWETPYAVATVRLLPDTQSFLTEAILLGYTPPECGEEDRGITFNTECSKTGDKHAIILLNYNRLDIETICHEIRHAYFWVMANQHGTLSLNVLDEDEDERFCARLDQLNNRCISTIQAQCGNGLQWKVL
jgi:hypothetical protein